LTRVNGVEVSRVSQIDTTSTNSTGSGEGFCTESPPGSPAYANTFNSSSTYKHEITGYGAVYESTVTSTQNFIGQAGLDS